MTEILSSIPSIFVIVLSIFITYKSYKREKGIHNKIIKDVTKNPDLAKMAMEDFPELKEEIIRITNKHN